MVICALATSGLVAFPSLILTDQVAVSPGLVASPEPISNVLDVPTVLYGISSR